MKKYNNLKVLSTFFTFLCKKLTNQKNMFAFRN